MLWESFVAGFKFATWLTMWSVGAVTAVMLILVIIGLCGLCCFEVVAFISPKKRKR